MAFANRGEFAEKKVKEHLELWHVVTDRREYARLVDTKAAGRIIKAADADFAYYCHDLGTLAVHGLIEVKETEHLYRLARDKVSQLPRLRKREKCGAPIIAQATPPSCKVLAPRMESELARF